MLSLVDTSRASGRREFLRIGTCAVGGLSLAGILRARQALGAAAGSVVKDRSVVLLNLQGGPTQFETFDPKMSAPREIRSITGEIPTSLPGITFGGTLPRLARLADRMAIVRSYRHGISDHGRAAMHVMAGGNSTGAMMGALYARVAGLSDAGSGLPRNVLVTAASVGETYRNLYAGVSRVSQTGTLPAAYRPLDPSAGTEIIDNMSLRVDRSRLGDRRYLLDRLDSLRRELDLNGRLDAAGTFRRQAFDVLLRGAAGAFDLSREDPATIERYDTGSFASTEAVKKRNEYARQFSPIAIGRQMLMARRLCEAGCGFVTLTFGGWDMHGGGKEFTMADGVHTLTPALDKAVSAFIEDVEQRGLSERILLVITGEFGRTPKVNKKGGRDHWANLATLAFAGGGLQTGGIVGRSDHHNAAPDSPPVSPRNMMGTILHTLFDVGAMRVARGVPREMLSLVESSRPIDGLL